MDQSPTIGPSQGLDQKMPAGTVRTFPLSGASETGGHGISFPGDDNHRSLAQMAKSDLEAALQLLVDRAQYITGSSGAAIALRDREQMICRASAGPSAPQIGAHLQLDSGLTGESVRQKKLMRCDDVESDLRVNRESCRALGIVSVVVLPLIREEKVFGIFELLSGKAYAFEERDIIAVKRLGEMIQTALDVEPDTGSHLQEIEHPENKVESAMAPTEIIDQVLDVAVINQKDSEPVIPVDPETVARLHASIGKCAACGFPVSGGRKYCLDCETMRASDDNPAVREDAPDFLAHYSDKKEKNWFSRNIYWIGIVAMSLGTAALLLLR
jgi:putative methionine-R-sulfoxide reductase with GAF domain